MVSTVGPRLIALAKDELHTRLERRLGQMAHNDEIGLFSHKRFALQYAYHHRIWGGRLSIGVQADMLQEDLDGSKADLGTGNDPAFPSSKVNGSAFDAFDTIV